MIGISCANVLRCSLQASGCKNIKKLVDTFAASFPGTFCPFLVTIHLNGDRILVYVSAHMCVCVCVAGARVCSVCRHAACVHVFILFVCVCVCVCVRTDCNTSSYLYGQSEHSVSVWTKVILVSR